MRPLAVVCLIVSLAHAHPPVALEIGDCTSADEIRRIGTIELGEPFVETAPDRTRAAVHCMAGTAELRVDDPTTHKSLTRTIALAPDKGQARLIAIAIVELISTSWTELVVESPPVQPPAHERSVPFLRAFASGGGLVFTDGTGLLVGGGVRLTGDTSPIGWLAAVEAHHGASAVSLGDVTTTLVHVGGAAVVHRSWSRITLRGGLGLRGGMARLGGATVQMSVRADHFWAPWVGALALGDVEIAMSSRIVLDLTIESGRVIQPVGGLVAGQREVAVDGEWMHVHLGVGVIL